MPPRRARASSGSDSGDEDIVKLAAKVFQNEAEGIIPPRPPVRPASIAVSTKAIGPPTPDLNSPLPPIPNDQYSDETETSDEEDWQGSEEEEDRPLPPPPELPTRDSPQPANFVPPHPLRRAMSHRSGTSASGSVNGDALGVALPPGRSSPSKRDQKGPPVELPNPLDCTPHPMFYSSMGDVDIIAEHTLFKVHSSVLTMNSRKLSELIEALRPKLPDGTPDASEPMVHPLFLLDESAARFSTLLTWMYPGSSPTKGKSSSEQRQVTERNVLDLMALGVKYDSPKLTKECEEFLRGVEPASVIFPGNLEECFYRSAEYKKRGMVRLQDMCFKYLHDAAADPVYPGDPVPLLLLAERYRLPTVRYQAWAKVVSALPSVQHTPSYSRLASDTRQAMRNLRYNIMCAFETVGRLVFQLYPNECGCRGQALSDWYERTGSAWVDSWKWDAEGSLRLSFAVPQLGTCEAHAEEQLMRHVEVQQCWVAEQELYDGFEVMLEIIEPSDSVQASLENLRLNAESDGYSEQS